MDAFLLQLLDRINEQKEQDNKREAEIWQNSGQALVNKAEKPLEA